MKYLEDQNRRYGRDKMPPFRCRILKLSKISAKHALNNNGQTGVSITFSQILSSRASKSYPFAIFFSQQLSLAENDFHIEKKKQI